jgi:uncharacterized phage protein (TIGR02218 family)
MKAASAGFIALLNGNNVFLMADLYTFTLRSGTILHWTSADIDIVLSGTTFTTSIDQGTQPLLQRGNIRMAKGLEVGTMDLDLLCGGSAQISGVKLPLYAHNGGFDGCRVKVERVFMPTWGDTSNGSTILFEGNVAGIDPSSTLVSLKLKDDRERLTNTMPHTLFMPGCSNTFGDANCGKDLITLTDAGTAGAGTNATQVNVGTGHADGYYSLGVLAMTSGAAAGSRRAVKSYLSGIAVLTMPLPSSAAPGDTFTIYPGCGRTQAACLVWANLNRFRGCPYVPPPETTR